MKLRLILAIGVALLLALPLSAAAHQLDKTHAHHRSGDAGYGMGGYGMGGFGMGGPGMGGPGMGGFGMMGPGMGGFGMMGPGMGGFGMMGWVDDLPQEKQKQLDALHLSMMSAMRAKHRDMSEARNAMHEAMHSYPVNQAAAQQALERITQLHKEMFAFGLGMMQQMQEIIGKERWEDMQQRFDELHERRMGSWGRGDRR